MTCHQYGSGDDVVKMAKEVGGWGGKESGWISVCRPQKSPTVCPRKNGRPNISVWQEQTLQSSFNMCYCRRFSVCTILQHCLTLTIRVSALWLLRNYFTGRPHRVKHDFGLYVPRQFCKVFLLLWLYYAQFARAMEVSNICESLVRYLLRYRDLWRHWARPLWNWAPCAGKQLGHITDCFMDSFKRHRNRILAWRLIPVHIQMQNKNDEGT